MIKHLLPRRQVYPASWDSTVRHWLNQDRPRPTKLPRRSVYPASLDAAVQKWRQREEE